MIESGFIESDQNQMRILQSMPKGDGPFPVYIECLHAPGQDGFTEHVLERWSDNGYAAFSHNLFHRLGPDAKGREAIPHLTDREMLADTQVLIEHIESLPNCDTNRMLVGGHCMGGRVTLLVAAHLDRFKAAADFWGGNVMTGKGENAPKVIDLVKNIKCPVIGFFGDEDENPSPGDVDTLDRELTTHNIPHEFHRYADAGHAFQNMLNEEKYRAGPAEDAWNKVIQFFDKSIGKAN